MWQRIKDAWAVLRGSACVTYYDDDDWYGDGPVAPVNIDRSPKPWWGMKDRPEFVDLIQRAVANFKAMTPEQQEAEMKLQRESWARQDMD